MTLSYTIDCDTCSREFSPAGSSQSGGAWPYSWEPDTYVCEGCEGRGRCEDEDCYRDTGATRWVGKDRDLEVAGTYCDKCWEVEKVEWL
jgi:hypothetical protein